MFRVDRRLLEHFDMVLMILIFLVCTMAFFNLYSASSPPKLYGTPPYIKQAYFFLICFVSPLLAIQQSSVIMVSTKLFILGYRGFRKVTQCFNFRWDLVSGFLVQVIYSFSLSKALTLTLYPHILMRDESYEVVPVESSQDLLNHRNQVLHTTL